MPSSGLLTLYHPALDAGSIPSRHPQPKAKRFGLGIHIPFCHPALDAGSSPAWIPACAGMTSGTRMTIDESRIIMIESFAQVVFILQL